MQEPISSDSLWYDAERIELKIFPDGRETIITQSLFDYYNGEIRAVLQYYALPVEGIEGSESSGTALCVFDNTGALKKSVDINSLIADANTPYVSMRTCGFDKDKLYVLAQDVTTDSRGFLIAIDINSERQISKTEFTGTSAQEICSFLPDRLMIVKDNVFMMCDDTGRIVVFDTNGNYRSDMFSSLFNQNIFFWDAYSDKNGTVSFSCTNAQEGEINIQLGSETITYKTKNYNLGGAIGASASDDGSYYAVSYSGISKYNQETAKFDMLIPVDSFNVNLHEFFLMSVLSADENTMVLANTHGADLSTGLVAYRLTKASANPNEGKSRITIGLFKDHIIPPTLAMAIYEFNANSKDYYAGFKTYDYSRTYFEDADSEEKARQEKANELMRDIMDGKGPDVVINAFDIQQLNDDKYLCDMSDLVSSGNGINMAEYIEPVINLAKSEGKLYQKIADLMGKVTYTLDNEQVKDDKATVDGHFKVYDMAASYNEMINRLVAEVSNDAENKSEEEINERVYTFWLEELEKIEERGADLDFHYSFELAKGENGWNVDDVSSDRTFLDGMMGGLISTIEGY